MELPPELHTLTSRSDRGKSRPRPGTKRRRPRLEKDQASRVGAPFLQTPTIKAGPGDSTGTNFWCQAQGPARLEARCRNGIPVRKPHAGRNRRGKPRRGLRVWVWVGVRVQGGKRRNVGGANPGCPPTALSLTGWERERSRKPSLIQTVSLWGERLQVLVGAGGLRDGPAA